MDFTLTDDQQLLRETARTLLTKECPPSLLRAHMDDPSAADPLWKHLSEWVPLADGPLVNLCLFLEEAGAVLLPGPFFATTALYVPLMRALGRPPAATGTVAMDGPVIEAGGAGEVAVVVPGRGVVVTEAVTARPLETLDTTRRLFEVELPAGAPPPVPLDAGSLDAVVARATVALAAEMVGTARRLLDMTVAYAKERVQFDRPIGSFQAVQHKLADMSLDVERASAAVSYAAMAIDAGDPGNLDAEWHRAVHVAKAAAGRAAKRAARDGIQIHGGIGYTWEHDLHLYMRRAYASEFLLGPSDWHHDRLADLLFEGGG